jgi:hypothetical protein
MDIAPLIILPGITGWFAELARLAGNLSRENWAIFNFKFEVSFLQPSLRDFFSRSLSRHLLRRVPGYCQSRLRRSAKGEILS